MTVSNLCWHYNNEDPLLQCSVNPVESHVIWKRDSKLIGLNGTPVGEDRQHYSITSSVNGTQRVEVLQVNSSLVAETHSFWCEHQGISSQHIIIIMPGKSSTRIPVQ